VNKVIKTPSGEIPATGQNVLLTVAASGFHFIPQTQSLDAINHPESNRHKGVEDL